MKGPDRPAHEHRLLLSVKTLVVITNNIQTTFHVPYRCLHFEERVSGDHIHLDTYPQHRVVLTPARVVPLQQAPPRGLTSTRQLSQVHIAETQLLV